MMKKYQRAIANVITICAVLLLLFGSANALYYTEGIEINNEKLYNTVLYGNGIRLYQGQNTTVVESCNDATDCTKKEGYNAVCENNFCKYESVTNQEKILMIMMLLCGIAITCAVIFGIIVLKPLSHKVILTIILILLVGFFASIFIPPTSNNHQNEKLTSEEFYTRCVDSLNNEYCVAIFYSSETQCSVQEQFPAHACGSDSPCTIGVSYGIESVDSMWTGCGDMAKKEWIKGG